MGSSDAANARAVMRLSPPDNVAVALRPLKAGETVMLDGEPLRIGHTIGIGRKLAARAIARGELVVKYGCPLGTATADIAAGEYVHTHNVDATYPPTTALQSNVTTDRGEKWQSST